MCFHDNTYLPTFQNLKHPNKITKQPSIFPDWSLWEYIMHFSLFLSPKSHAHYETCRAMTWRCHNAARISHCVAASLHHCAWLRQWQKCEENADLSIPGQESQILPQKDWTKLDKIVGYCSNVLCHYIFSNYGNYPHSIHHSHFVSVCEPSSECTVYAQLSRVIIIPYIMRHHWFSHMQLFGWCFWAKSLCLA